MLNNTIRSLFNKIAREIFSAGDYLYVLNELAEELKSYLSISLQDKPLRILFGPSFSVYAPCFVHDRILSYALQLRGSEIYPIYCDAIQRTECNYYGGVWKTSFNENCQSCVEKSKLLWAKNKNSPIGLSKYLYLDDTKRVDDKIANLDAGSWFKYEEKEEGFSLGAWAKDILVNHYVVGDYQLIDNHEYLGKEHLRNLLLLKIAYERTLLEIKPDRVITNDSYYGMWVIMQVLCKKHNIPFYSNWAGTSKNTWCYAFNDAAYNLDFSRSWQAFSKTILDPRKQVKIDKWLKRKESAKDSVLPLFLRAGNKNDYFEIGLIDREKPTALLPANVIWDLAALNKSIFFDSMIDWIVETIDWFKQHAEYQLVIKAHPGELHPLLPKTKERIEVALLDRGISLSSNIFLLSPQVKTKVYDLFPLIKVGLVYTTSVGFEMAARGIPVITVGKSPYRGFGFTYDPNSKEDYFKTLNSLLCENNAVSREGQKELAYKYILFYFYHYFIRMNIMDYSYGGKLKLKIHSIKQIFPGKNLNLDYVVNSILKGLPIISEKRWPPES